jgi:hypothetical protein
LQVVVEPLEKRGEHEKWRPWHTNEAVVAEVRGKRKRTPRGSKRSRATVMHAMDSQDGLVISE